LPNEVISAHFVRKERNLSLDFKPLKYFIIGGLMISIEFLQFYLQGDNSPKITLKDGWKMIKPCSLGDNANMTVGPIKRIMVW